MGISAIDLLNSLGSNSIDPAARRKLAGELDFDRYFALARIYDLNHTFWDGLLADRNTNGGTVLVLETRLGAISASLARRFSRVVSCHASDAAALATSAWLETSRLANVSVVVADCADDFCKDDIEFDAIVLVGPDTDPTGQWGSDGELALSSVLQIARTRLRSKGQLVVADNNRWSYKKSDGEKARRGLALLLLMRQLCAVGLPSEVYVCGASLTPSHSPPPDFFRRSSVSAGTNLPKNWRSSLKASVLNKSTARLFWPSFLLVASREPEESFLDRLIMQPKIATALGWHGEDQVEIKRLIAGNSGTSIVIAGPKNRESADVVVRLPSTLSGEALCEVNARALLAMKNTSWFRLVPKLVDEGTLSGRRYFVETRCAGFEVYSGTHNLARMLMKACASMSMLQHSSAEQVNFAAADFERQVAPLIDDLIQYADADMLPRLLRLKDALRANMYGCIVFMGQIHGDFKLGNILFDRSGELTALIDWDGFSASSFLLFDYLTLLTYKLSYDFDVSMAQVFVEYLLPWKLPLEYGQFVNHAVVDLKSDDKSFLYVRVVFWFALLNARFDGVYKYHARWHQIYVLPVVDEVERMLGLRDFTAAATGKPV